MRKKKYRVMFIIIGILLYMIGAVSYYNNYVKEPTTCSIQFPFKVERIPLFKANMAIIATNELVQDKVLIENNTQKQRFIRAQVIAEIKESNEEDEIDKQIPLVVGTDMEAIDIVTEGWVDGEDGYFYYLELVDPKKVFNDSIGTVDSFFDRFDCIKRI